MGRTVALIIGAAYSGSSLLTLLLDAQPAIRGLGEAVNLITGNDKAHCVVCAKPVWACPLHALVDRRRFYGSLFDYYGDCEVLVDSSKSVQGCLGLHPFEKELFTEKNRYLQGKYAGKYHTIFYDNQWQSDKSFIETCLQLYHSHRREFQDTLHNLQQLDVVQQIDDLQRVLTVRAQA